MASQVSHIVYAKKYFETLELAKIGDLTEGKKMISSNGKINKDEFFLGCIFPDIRRIDPGIKRKSTHLNFSPLDLNFERLTSFEAGWKFHLYCDMKREEVLNKYKFYSLKNSDDYYNLPAKLLEDEVVYESYNNWEKITSYFNNPPYIDLGLSIKPETFRYWYAVIAKYLEAKPNDKTMRVLINKQPSLISHVDTIMESVISLRKNKKAVEILKKVKEEIIQ
jgi:hypothetical protein